MSQIKKEKQNEEKFPKYVLVADVNQVKEYLFASVRLRHIVNASALLSDVNERHTKSLIEQYKKVHNDTKSEIIFTGGGVTQAVFNQKEAAEDCKKKLSALYPSKTGTATIAAHVEQWTGEEKFVNVIRRAVRKVREKKDSGKSDKEQESEQEEQEFEPIAFSSGSSFFRICEQTGKEFATKWGSTPDGKQAFGKSVWTQRGWRQGKESKQRDYLPADRLLRKLLAKHLKINSDRFVYYTDFEKITEDAKPQNYLGFMDADGNSMGDMLSALAIEKAEEDDYREFSQILASSTRKAYLKAASNVLVPFFKKQINNNQIQIKNDKQKIKLPIRLLIMGGDDVMVVSLPQLILPFANEFCREFQRIAEEKKKNSERKVVKKLDEFTMSAGVVIAHRGFPFLSFRRLGNRLLKSAKKRAWAAKRDKQGLFGSVDFQIITASGAEDLKRLRNEDYTLNFKNEPEISLTGRPYLVSPELDELSNLRHIVAKMKMAQISRRQVKSLSDILRSNSTRALLDFIRWFNRLSDSKIPETTMGQELKKIEVQRNLREFFRKHQKDIIRNLLNQLLFSVELDLDLDNNTDIPQSLRSLFEKYAEPLSDKVEIEVLRERSTWAIKDKGQTYILQKDQKIVFCYLMEMLCVSPWLKDERLGKFKRPDCYTPLLDAAELFELEDELAQSEIQPEEGGES